MWGILSEFLLICHFSLVFSLTVLCSVFFIRTRDKIVLRLLRILYPLFLYCLSAVYHYSFSEKLSAVLNESVSAVSLFFLLVSTITVPLVLYSTSDYMISLLDLPEKNRRFARFTVSACSLVFFVFGLYFIVYLNSPNWVSGLSRALNELFIYGSFLQFLPAVTAAAYLKRTQNLRKKQLLKGVIISFIPIVLFAASDLFLFKDSPYKLVYISYLLFAVLVYLFTARHYIHRYIPENPELPDSCEEFYRQNAISEREQELIPFLIEGRSNREISQLLFISPNTVKTHIRNIYRKAGVSNRLQLLSRIRANPEG